MTINIDHNFIQNFGDNFELVAQQQSSILRQIARERPMSGESFTIERLHNPNDTLPVINTRHADTKISDMEHSRRTGFVHDYADAYMIDTEDKIKMLLDPTSDYIMEMAGQFNRTIDDALIEALLGNSYEGKLGGTVSRLPTSQAIAHGSAGLTLAKLKAGMKKLKQGFVDLDREDVILLTNAEGYDDLANDDGVDNIQNVPFRVNYDYQVPMIAGAKIINCERLNNYTGIGAGTAASASDRPAVLFCASTLRLGMAAFYKSITREALKNGNWVLLLKTSFAVARAHDEKVIDIRFQE